MKFFHIITTTVVTSLDSDLYPKYSFKRETIDIIANKFVFLPWKSHVWQQLFRHTIFNIKLKWPRNRQTYCVKENSLKFCPQKVSSKFPNGLFCFQIHCNQILLDIAVLCGISNQPAFRVFWSWTRFWHTFIFLIRQTVTHFSWE